MDKFFEILDWVTKNWETVVGAVTTLIGVITAIVTAIKNKNWTALKDAITGYIKDAELLNADGSVKKEIVLAKARTLCVKLHIKYNEKRISAIIESIILISKIVNGREKDKAIVVPTDIGDITK